MAARKTSIKDERDLEAYLTRRAAESRTMVFSNGTSVSGEPLERYLERLTIFRKLLHVVERRGPSRRAILALLEGQARDRVFWGDRATVAALADHLRTATITTDVQEDAEHQAFAVVLEGGPDGYARRHRLDLDFVTTGEFRTLAHAYQDVRVALAGPVAITTTGARATEDTDVVEGEAPDAKPQVITGIDDVVTLAMTPRAGGTRRRDSPEGCRDAPRPGRGRGLLHRRRAARCGGQPLQGPRGNESRHLVGNHHGSRRSAPCSRSGPRITLRRI